MERAAARGEILCFTDADSRVHPATFAAIDAALADPTVAVGATGMVAERESPGINLTMGIMKVVVFVMNVDAGVVFCRRSLFERIGGYDERLQVAEDVQFLLDMKRLGRFRRARGAPATMSTRKWDQHGDWHMFTMGPRLLWNFMTARESITQFAKRYWYDDRR